MKLLKYTAILLLTLVVLVVALASPWGTRALLSIADSSLEELNIDYGSGSLVSALSLKRVRWQSSDIDLSLNNVLIDVNWSCSVAMRACLSQLSAKGISVKLHNDPNPQNAGSAKPLKRIVLPFPLKIDSLDVHNINVAIPQTMQLKVGSVASSISMFRTLNIAYLKINDVQVKLPKAAPLTSPSEPLDIADISNWTYQPPTFSPILFPIVVKAKGIDFTAVSVTQGKAEIAQIERLQAVLNMTTKMLTLTKLEIVHPLAAVSLTATVDKNWQHKLQASMHSRQNEKYPLNVTIVAQGSPRNINIELTSKGFVNLNTQVNADLTTKQLPLTVMAKWQDISWPVSKPEFTSAKGKLDLKGDLNLYQLAVQSTVQGPTFPAAEISMIASGNNKRAKIKQLQIQTLGGEINLDAEVNLTQNIAWQGGLRFKEIKPQVFWPQLTAQVAGNVMHSGQFDGQALQAKISQLQATGTWQGYTLAANGSATFDEQQGLQIPDLSISTGQNKLHLKASVRQLADLDAKLSLDAQNLSQLYPALEGQSQLNATVSGTLAEPRVVFDGSAKNLFIEHMTIANINTQGDITWDANKKVNLELTLKDAFANNQPIESLELKVAGNAAAHSVSLNLHSENLNLLSKLSGELTPQQWSGYWDTADFSFDGGQFTLDDASPQIMANWQQKNYGITPFCWADAAAKLCIKDAHYQSNKATFNLTATELPVLQLITAYIPGLEKIQTDAALNFEINGSWAGKGLPQAQAHAELTPSTWSVEGQKSPLHLQSLYMDLDTVDQPGGDKQDLVAKLHLLSEQLGLISADMKIQASPGERPVQGLIKLDDLQLKALQKFVPQLTELTGQINGQLNLAGTLADPLLEGTVNLREGTFAGSMLPARINHVDQIISFDGKAASISGPFQLGNGKGQIEGTFNWQDQPTASFNVSGTDMEIDYQNLVRAKLSPDIQIDFTPQSLTVNGELSLPYARVKVRELPPEAMSPSSDVVLVNDTDVQQESGIPLQLKLQVNIDPKRTNDVKLDAFGLTSDLQGALLLTQSGKVLIANGELNLLNGRYKAYGQDLVIRQGEVQFSGPIDSPYLNIEAVRDPLKTADDVVAGLRIEGNAEQPTVSVFSDPVMEQPEALSYLLRGESISGQGDTSNDAMLANALIGFGLGKSENNVSTIGRKLGVEDLALNTSGQGDETKLSVSGYIAPGVQIRYGVGVFDSAAEVALRYQLMPKLYIEAVSGTANALDIYYQFSIYEDGNKPVNETKKR